MNNEKFVECLVDCPALMFQVNWENQLPLLNLLGGGEKHYIEKT